MEGVISATLFSKTTHHFPPIRNNCATPLRIKETSLFPDNLLHDLSHQNLIRCGEMLGGRSAWAARTCEGPPSFGGPPLSCLIPWMSGVIPGGTAPIEGYDTASANPGSQIQITTGREAKCDGNFNQIARHGDRNRSTENHCRT